ncbi:MAG TPA: penicillin acylase family protein [Thermoanaerobaculia bacterium]
MSEALAAPRPEPETASPPPRPAKKRSLLRRIALALLVLLGLLVLILAAGALWVRSEVKASLPQLDGERAVAGLSAPVTVERDSLGVPTIRAASRRDAVRALGFLHAQERFFQMDLLRRSSAGELSEVFGPGALKADRAIRIHRFRHVARQTLARATAEERQLMDAYTGGVNAGLASLRAKPFEYLALRTDPAPWKPEDTLLVVFAMFIDLHDEDGSRESSLGLMRDLLPAPLYAFLDPRGTEWDAPIVGEPFAMPPIPGPEVIDLRKSPASLPKAAALDSPRWRETEDEEILVGSNNWAVAGTHTADGRALLADDMHLGIRVPNTWYRASIVRPDGRGGEVRLTGVTLPGTPSVVVGSNGHVAWGFTNSYGDWSDLVILETDPRDPEVYRTPRGPRRFAKIRETIKAKGQADETLEVRSTIWGPVLDQDHRGRPRAFSWIAHHPEAVSFGGFFGMDDARTVEEAMAVANRSGIPPQNFVVADETGRIGWTIMGAIPRRVGFDGRVPTSWTDGSHRWDGWLTPEEFPRVIDPPSGRIWSANARVVDGEMLAKLGDGGFDLGARARQIRDRLLAIDKATPRDLLAVQLDDRAVFLERWRKVLLDTLTPEAVAADPRRRELRRLVEETWTGHASIDSVSYRMVRGFRGFLSEQVFAPLLAHCEHADERFEGMTRQFEGPLWALVTQRPMHLLDPKFKSWDEQLLSAVDELLDYYGEQGGNLADRTWGERNATQIQHPMSQAVPFLSRWLDVPPRHLPGDSNMPRVQGPGEGASERLVVSPGQEEKGIFHMPVGQSGHPMSPFYQAGHKAWEEGQPTPFLPGKAVHRLTLTP